jgi:hypothetical protein
MIGALGWRGWVVTYLRQWDAEAWVEGIEAFFHGLVLIFCTFSFSLPPSSLHPVGADHSFIDWLRSWQRQAGILGMTGQLAGLAWVWLGFWKRVGRSGSIRTMGGSLLVIGWPGQAASWLYQLVIIWAGGCCCEKSSCIAMSSLLRGVVQVPGLAHSDTAVLLVVFTSPRTMSFVFNVFQGLNGSDNVSQKLGGQHRRAKEVVSGRLTLLPM